MGMNLRLGEEFAIKAGSEEWWREHGYLRTVDNGSVLTPGAADNGGGSSSRRIASADGAFEMIQMLDQEQARAARIAALNDRLADLDGRSAEALRAAQEHLDEILRTANRTTDGRIVFQDEDGTIYDEHGNEVDPGDVDPDTWRAEAPSWEEYQDGLSDVAKAEDHYQRVQDLRDRLTDGPTDEELADIDNEIAALESEMPTTLIDADHTATAQTRPTSAVKLLDGEVASGATLRAPFIDAVTPTDPMETDPPVIAPGAVPTPG